MLALGFLGALAHCGGKSKGSEVVASGGDSGGQAGEAAADSAGTGEMDVLCPRVPLVFCEAPSSGDVIVDISPPCAIVFDGQSGRCVPTARLPDEDREKRCSNAAFWAQQERLFETQAACRARCGVEGGSGTDCDQLP